MGKFVKIIFLFLWLATAIVVRAASDESVVNVSYRIPANSCQGCGGPGNDASTLAIANVSTTVGISTSTISWVATSNYSITRRSFTYGLTTSYGESVNVVEDEIDLQGLVTDTDYFFKITVVDSLNKVVDYTGSFRTARNISPMSLLISNVVITPAINQAVVTFEISEDATAQVDYSRLDGSLATTLLSTQFTSEKIFQLDNLVANTDYHLKITVTAVSGQSTSTDYLNFKTLLAEVGPPNVTNALFQMVAGKVYLSWRNPLQSVSPNFVGVRIVKGARTANNPTDGQIILNARVENFTDSAVQRGGTYYYTIFSYDTSGLFSSGVAVHGTVPLAGNSENCSNGIDDDVDGRVDCADSDCGSASNCSSSPGTSEVCNNSIDDDRDGVVDCSDSDCAGNASCSGGGNSEVCDNGLDDDTNGLIDCLDLACVGFPACVGDPPVVVEKKECSDGIDNDSNGKIDWPNDVGCENADDGSEFSPPIQNVSEGEDVVLGDLEFYSGQGTLRILPVGDRVSGLAGYDLSLIWRPEGGKKVESVQFRLGSDTMNVSFDEIDNYYTTKFSFPVGEKSAYFQINYGLGKIDTVNFKVVGNYWGKVEANKNPLANVEVYLYRESGELFDAEKFSQSNPKLTGKDGFYGWMLPSGNYYVVTKHAGFFDYRSPTLNVSNGYWSKDLKMIERPKPIIESIKSEDSLIQNIGNVSASVINNVVAMVEVFKQMVDVYADNPQVEKITKNIVAPATVATVAVVAVPAMSLPGVIALFRFVFLQPLMLLGRKRRKKWGLVYNSLDKMPIDLAIVRLVDKISGKIVQSRVTDQKGRYFFVAKPGNYRIEVSKERFVFPTALLFDMKTDSEKVDLYHGEDLGVDEDNAVITANIPIDPIGVTEKPRRIAREKALRTTRGVISSLGIVASLVAVYVLPVWQTWTLLGFQVVMGVLFARLSRPLPIRGWGIVYDSTGKKPLVNVVARLFNSKFNKLVTSQVTDSRGRYYLMAADDLYFATFDKTKYNQTKVDEIDMRGKNDNVVTVNVPLIKR